MGGTSESIIDYEQKFDGVRYLGSVGINKSLLPYPPEHRELIVSAAIHKLFNETDLDVPPTPIVAEVDQLPHSKLNEILGKTRIARNPRARATTRVTTKNIQISMVDSQSNAGYFQDRSVLLAHHQMDVISFASLDMSVYVSYVAKDTGKDGMVLDDTRACHVIECEDPRQANDMYAAVENAFNQRTRMPIKPFIIPEPGTLSRSAWDDTLPAGSEPSYYNTDPNRQPPISGLERQPMPRQERNSNSVWYANQDVIDNMVENAVNKKNRPIPSRRSGDRTYVNQDVVDELKKNRNSSTESMSPSSMLTQSTALTQSVSSVHTTSTHLPSSSSTSSIGSMPAALDDEPDYVRRLRKIVMATRILQYFHTFSSDPRREAGEKLKSDGDFLLREASVFLVPNQLRNITLSVLNRVKGKMVIKHVLLVMSPEEDAENPIHTRDQSFASIEELIDHYMQNGRILQMPRDHADHDEDNIRISNPIIRNIFMQKPTTRMLNEYV